jgi:hypothetical protein
MLVRADVDEANYSLPAGDKAGRAGDFVSVQAQGMVNAVGSRNRAILVEQEGEVDRVLTQILFRLEKAGAPLGGYIDQTRAGGLDFISVRLELSHALNAVGSPGAAQKFHDHRPVCN